MEQTSTRLEYKVGFFLAIGLLAVLVSILLLGGDKAFFTSYVNLKSRFTEVQGLFPGSVVSLAGVPVGNIKRIDFVPSENKLEVTMQINRAFQNRLVDGTVAEVKTQGALGDKYIYLAPGAPGGKLLEDEALIPSIETDYLKLLTDREQGFARVVDLIKEMHILIATINNKGKTAEMMTNLSEASAKLKSTLGQLDSLLADIHGEIPQNKKVQKALISLSNVLEKVDKGQGTLGQLINDPSVYQNLKSMLGGSPRNTYMKNMIRETIQQSESGR